MQFSNFGSWFVAVLSASMAAGAALPRTKVGVVEFKQTRSERFVGRNGPLALARAYNKYGIPVSESLKNAAQTTSQAHAKRAQGTAVANSDQGDLEYLVQVAIGTPAQNLNLDFDTGSADLWVFSTETPNGGSHSLYSPGQSSTSQKQSGETWSIQYADGSGSSGDVYTDSVTVGGLTVPNQVVESAQQVSSQFASGDNDGLLGLSFSSLNTVTPNKASTWFDNVQSQLDSPLFVADLRHNAAGSYVFGGIPGAAQNILYTPVDSSRGWWGFSSSIGGSSVSGIADTGTTLLLLDDSIVSNYYQQVSGAVNDSQQGGWVFDCSAQLPSLSFSVGNGQITIDGSLLNYATQGSQCFGGLQSNNGNGLSIFGDIALKAAYVVFDAGNNQIGWAQK
ncbi:endothiapepsin precursor [Cordyceps militaris CM01]|uniref:Endothiapepsin n=1 Tax=Cordyceps militaris (strain CM01) TaxID=983644 RepID=G3JBW9_CORMM|nr:endothiapepsin precursor [Cordyceps militaris CM01]EGX94542.1 endothiapepsin precursor [Cordyceps militaris CM01]